MTGTHYSCKGLVSALEWASHYGFGSQRLGFKSGSITDKMSKLFNLSELSTFIMNRDSNAYLPGLLYELN